MNGSRPFIRQRQPVVEPPTDVPPVLARVLAGRGIASAAELDCALAGLLPPELAAIDVATERLARALDRGERILVVGDFDADGATSVALALRALRAFGHTAVDYLVPNRFESGYGLTRELIDQIPEPVPELILTVDNGVASHDGVAAAAERGIEVVITDHHLPGDTLPHAVAVVNPNRADCTFASKHLAGVGVVFYLLGALRARLAAAGHFADGALPSMANWLDLVALGTVADVVQLDHNNRILVEQGLRRIRAGHACPGIEALLSLANRNPRRTTAADLGFAAAPRLNAAGRLADMAQGIEALITDDEGGARRAAQRLDGLNRDRREIEAEMKEQADREVERLRATLADRDALPAGLVLYDERWHQGVSGILAGRVREAVHRPTIILADAGDGLAKGSARSIPGLHIRDVLAAVAAARPNLIGRFGGHAQAAGLLLEAAAIDEFRAAFAAEVERALGGTRPVREIITDGELRADEISRETAELLRGAGPWGAGFPEPAFDGVFRVRDHRIVGEQHLKLTVEPAAGGPSIEAIAFRADPAFLADPGPRVRLVYRLDINEYRGRQRLQLVVEHIEADVAEPEAEADTLRGDIRRRR